MPKSAGQLAGETRGKQMKLLLWPLILALLAGIGGLGEPLEDTLRVLRNKLHPTAASGDIVIVQVDPKSLREIGAWPWPRKTQAELVDRLSELGAKQIVADIMYPGRTSAEDDQALGKAAAMAGNVTVATMTRYGRVDGKEEKGSVIPEIAEHSKIGTASLQYNWQNAVWSLPRGHVVQGETIPSLSWIMAGSKGNPTGEYRIDFSIEPESVPVVGAGEVLKDRVARSTIAGKTVIFGINSYSLGDQYLLPGYWSMGGVYIHVLGAETLKLGNPVNLGWVPAMLLAFAASLLTVRYDRIRFVAGMAAIIVAGSVMLESYLLFVDVVPALALLAILAGKFTWRRLRAGGLTNALTGLPNLAALRAAREGRDMALVGVKVHNFPEIASTLNADGERKLVEQIIQRLTIGNRERIIYQGDEGIFAWFADKETPFASQLEALHALFRSPIRVDKTSYDIALSFGVELGSNRSISSRMGSALVAAQEADAESLKWKFHDPARLQEVPWRLSLLSQLDEAIDKGEVWLAFQPKLDLATRQTVGAEALARWTHPEKGPISPTEFISAAEQSDRIEHLTDFVLDQAIAGAAKVVRNGHDFDIAVNLSARMLNDRDLPNRVSEILTRHGLPAERLTLELTETAAVSESGLGLDLLARLRAIGVKIAIDDYGTGLSTLDYLKKVPASEIKIDQSFIRSMRDNRSDLIMVQSTITLAKALGRKVVAEGVEDNVSLEQLKTMGCDQVQGFIVGRPMVFDELVRRLESEKRRSSAA